MAEVARDRIFFQESGGGVTFSGGEPLERAQPDLGSDTVTRAAGDLSDVRGQADEARREEPLDVFLVE